MIWGLDKKMTSRYNFKRSTDYTLLGSEFSFSYKLHCSACGFLCAAGGTFFALYYRNSGGSLNAKKKQVFIDFVGDYPVRVHVRRFKL